jgi:N-acetylglucosaminyldiphosphoundecaprenol N-acetyl-beta-D-mannosaminyltransferase
MTQLRLTLGPLVVDRITTSRALARIDGMIRHGRGGFVVSPNADHLLHADRLPRLQKAYRQASISLANGRVLQLIALAFGRPIPEPISGPDFLFSLAQHAVERDYGVFLFGASESVSAKVSQKLQEQFPGLRIVGQDSSAWPNPHPRPLLRKIRESGAKLVIVGLGCPQQEAWMLQHAEDIQPAVAFGLGSALDIVAQEAKLTPRWMSRLGIGWSFHLVCEPCRMAHSYATKYRRIVPLFLRMFSRRLRGPQGQVETVST